MKRPSSGTGELALIERIRAAGRVRSPFVRLGIGDDCAVLRPPPGCDLVVTTDFTLEGVHFRCDWHSPGSAGHRCLARGLSDLAAMGAQPMSAFLSLALPKSANDTKVARRWVDRFLAGLHALAATHGVELAGGDTAEAPGEAILADIVLVGSAPRGQELRRSGAKPGDRLYCTGSLGGAAAELDLLRQGKKRTGKTDAHPQLFPEPRIAVGRALLKRRLATACMDLSDGISTDLGHLCHESGVSAILNAGALPIHPLAAALGLAEALRLALHGGEDYELLFAARSSTKVPKSIAGVAIAEIGRFEPQRKGQPAVLIENGDGQRQVLRAGGWQHFSG